MIKVMFVCHGNICRSPMAEFVLKDMVKKLGVNDKFEIASSATSREEIGNDMHHGSKNKLKAEGIPFSKRSARQFTLNDYDNYDYILLMEKYNFVNLCRIIGDDDEGKVHLLLEYTGENRDIADPWYTGNFDKTYSDIVRGCRGFLQKILIKSTAQKEKP